MARRRLQPAGAAAVGAGLMKALAAPPPLGALYRSGPPTGGGGAGRRSGDRRSHTAVTIRCHIYMSAPDNRVRSFYLFQAGKRFFDILAVHPFTNNPSATVAVRQTVEHVLAGGAPILRGQPGSVNERQWAGV